MPLYRVVVTDEADNSSSDEVEVKDRAELETLLCRTLADVLRDEAKAGGLRLFWADAHDERGERVMTARISLVVAEP